MSKIRDFIEENTWRIEFYGKIIRKFGPFFFVFGSKTFRFGNVFVIGENSDGLFFLPIPDENYEIIKGEVETFYKENHLIIALRPGDVIRIGATRYSNVEGKLVEEFDPEGFYDEEDAEVFEELAGTKDRRTIGQMQYDAIQAFHRFQDEFWYDYAPSRKYAGKDWVIYSSDKTVIFSVITATHPKFTHRITTALKRIGFSEPVVKVIKNNVVIIDGNFEKFLLVPLFDSGTSIKIERL